MPNQAKDNKVFMNAPIKYITTPVLAIALVILLLGCSSAKQEQDKIVPSFSIGYSTPEGNKIWVRKAEFDHSYTKPVGAMGCCWEEAGKSSAVHDRSLPKHVYIEWIDESNSLLYSAGVDLAPDIYARAMSMPEVRTNDGSYTEKGNIDVLIGMGEKGEVFVWLTNFPYSGGDMHGRVLEVVGQAQATASPWIKPE